jgi:acetyltransferase-like isoleucine patch superfamily enzyme
MRTLFRLALCLLPWALRRPLLQLLYGFEIHKTAKIGYSWVYPRKLRMEARTSIGHLTVIKGLETLELRTAASIGRLNWITAYPVGETLHFKHLSDDRGTLLLHEHAAITNRHLVDCTANITIGNHATVAGFRSQLLTHSIDLAANRQDAHPIEIGAYAFIGTACVLLGGARLPDHSVLGAMSLLNKAHETPYRLYCGVPAIDRQALSAELNYFHRAEGYVL